MRNVTAAIDLLDRLADGIGRAAAWLSLLLVLVTCGIVVARYVFSSGSAAAQDSLNYINALLFMLCAAWTLRHDGHVRVDLFYARASPRTRAWVDLLGGLLLLLPVCLFLIAMSWDYVQASWRVREHSPVPGGLPWVYLLKTLIPLMAGLLILQGVAEILRNALRLFVPHYDAGATRIGKPPVV